MAPHSNPVSTICSCVSLIKLKKMLRIVLTGFFALMLFTNCNLEQKTYKEEIARMEDTLFKAFPTINRVSIEVKNDFGTELNITFGDAQLYTASDAERQQAAEGVSAIAKSIFTPEDLPARGTLIFVKEENTIQVEEGSEITLPLSLKNPQ